MMRYSKEQIRKADGTNIVEYLLRTGRDLGRDRNEYYPREHDSLKINGESNKWNWFSRGKGGSGAISFLELYEGLTFPDAVRALTGEEPCEESGTRPLVDPVPHEPRELLLPEPAPDSSAVFTYLEGRGIRRDIIRRCVDEGTLYQTNMFWKQDRDDVYVPVKTVPQAVFVGKDPQGRPRYACTRSCMGSDKHDAPGSDKAYAFSFPGGDGCRGVWVFESAIDALSHATLSGYYRKEYDTHRISLGGVSPLALQQFLYDHPEIRYVNLGLDSDAQGRAATDQLKAFLGSRFTMYDHPPVNGKDYNEDLLIRQQAYRERKKAQSKGEER